MGADMNATVTGCFRSIVLLFAAAIVLCGHSRAQASAAASSTGFAPLEQWKSAIVAGDAAALKALYSTDPAAQVQANGVVAGADADVNFWLGLKARSLKLEIVRVTERPGVENFIFKAEVQTGLPNRPTVNVTDAQGWRKQGEQWRLVGATRTDAPRLKQPSDMKKNIYPADADAHAEIKEAEGRLRPSTSACSWSSGRTGVLTATFWI